MSNENRLDTMKTSLPLGATFWYLGRQCCALRYRDDAEAMHCGGVPGLVYEYVDEHGVIHSNSVATRDLDSFIKAATR